MSVPNSTPYFSAPRTWSRSTCNEYFTFRLGGRCVEAQRLEVSDHRNFIEGNPGLFDALGLAHSDGTHCGGSGQADGVTVTPGRHCAESVASNGASGGAKSAGNDSKGAAPAVDTADDADAGGGKGAGNADDEPPPSK
jgi:hypothetical protein